MFFDTVIVGSGIAGCSAAHYLAQQGERVALVTAAEKALVSNSAWAQGGIVYKGETSLVDDMLAAGAGASDVGVVEELARLGPACVKEFLIDELEVPFADRMTKEAAHSCSRILFSEDATGRAIMERLLQAVQGKVTLLSGKRVLDLAMDGGVCCGVHFDGETIFAGRTILASGGVGDLYLHTSNTEYARGEGIAMAVRAGAQAVDMQYVQFHPTAFPGERCFLLSEAMRGEGGKLVDSDFRPFMHRWHPDEDLAPRDIVARAVFAEMEKGPLFLDVTHLGKKYLEDRFPKIVAFCRERGIDPAEQPIPSVPCAHYHCGGIKASLSGETGVPGLWAIGEVACTGVHGANRLASTSLLEALVMGKLCAERSQKISIQQNIPKIVAHSGEERWDVLRQLMWDEVGIIRTREGLEKAALQLDQMRGEGPHSFYENALETASLIVQGAVRAAEPKGAHYILS